LTDAHKMLLSYTTNKQAGTPTNNNPRPQRHENNRGGGSGRSRGARSGRTFSQVASQVEFSLTQTQNHFPNGISPHFILLVSDSTISIFCNPDLLSDIHYVDDHLHLTTNGGHQVSTQMGTLKDFGPVWYNPHSIANILSLAQVRLVRRVTLDTAHSPTFHVHRLDGTGTTEFKEHPSGLYLHDTSLHIVNNDSITPVTAHSCLQTVANNKTKFTVWQIESADAARKLYRMLGRPEYPRLQTVADNKTKFTVWQIESADAARKLYRMLGRPEYPRFLLALKENHILNCPVTLDDARRAKLIYGKDIAFFKGKTTATAATEHIPDFTPIALPVDLLDLHPNVTLCVNLFYMLGLGFSLSTSRELCYLSCHPVADHFKHTLHSCISADLSLYRARGFIPTAIHADGEFHSLRTSFPDVHFTICSADDHVPKIERAIRTVKESMHTIIHGMPFARLPRVLVKELATAAVSCLNMLPHPDGVSSTLSPATIVTGAPKTDYCTLRLEFGSYVQVYDGTSNDTKSRTLGAIATNPTGNSNGDYYFMSLATGHRIHRRSWTVLPISDSVISRVEAIAFNENMPLVDTAILLTEYDPDAIC
jgi:hypothetical protein